MSDIAHDETDRIIEKIEKRLKREYAQAQKEIEEKLEDYFRRFEIKDKKWQEWVKTGKKSKEQYKRWRTGQLIMGKRWKDLKQVISEDLTHTNEIAASIVNGHKPEVYALNHNYATYEIEAGCRLDTSYTLYDRQSVERMFRTNPRMLPPPGVKKMRELYTIKHSKDVLWNQKQLQSVAMQAMLQGESISKVATRLSKEMGERNRKAAIRNARTLMTGAENAGRIDAYRRAETMGIRLKQQWVATLDMRTRYEHRELDGQRVEIGKPFIVPSSEEKIMFPGDPTAAGHLVYNCFVGKTTFGTNCGVVRSYKHLYIGMVVKVKTASGVNFTCTPNHPILTPNGWISAALLNKGDDLLVTKIGDESAIRGKSNVNHVYTTMKAFHDSFKRFGFVSRNTALSVNFHGDIPTTNVEVVTQKRELRNDINPACGNGINKFLFIGSDKTLMCKRTFMEHFRSVRTPTFCLVSGLRKTLTFFGGCLSHANIHRFRPIPNVNVVLPEYPINDLPGKTEIRSDLLDGLSGNVLVDNIVRINIVPALTHVYNLQTENGYYFVNESIPKNSGKYNGNMVIAKNCRCTLIGQIEGFETDTTAYRRDPDIDNMSYEDWKKSRKERPNRITLPEEKAKAIRNSYIREYRRK